jgi:hypothetical protein
MCGFPFEPAAKGFDQNFAGSIGGGDLAARFVDDPSVGPGIVGLAGNTAGEPLPGLYRCCLPPPPVASKAPKATKSPSRRRLRK